MNNKNTELDEMQREQHNRIGNQMFVIMSLAFLVNITLYGVGIRWLAYPADTMIILTVCLSVYLIRLIIAGAYQQPVIYKRKFSVITLTTAIALTVVFVMNIRKLPVNIVENPDDYSAYILVGISVIALVTAGVVSAIKKKRDNDDKDD